MTAADTRELVNERYTTILRPSDRAPIYSWARQIKLDSTSPIAGSYRIENSVWLKPIFDAYQDDSLRMLTVIGPNQGGRTKLMEVCSLWAAQHRPGPMQWNTYTDKRAKDFAEERWWPMAKSCADIVKKLPAGGVSEGKGRHQERIQKVIFTDGMPFIIQGCTESNLEEKSIMTQFNDECFQWPTGRMEYAHIRCNVAYSWNYKIINGSAVNVEGDDIHNLFSAGTQEELHWHCLKCGKPQIPAWGGLDVKGGIKWDTSEATKPKDEWDYEEVKKTVRYECINCGEAYEDNARSRRVLNETIMYIAMNTAASREHRSFRYNILVVNWPGLTWGRWVEEYLKSVRQMRMLRNLEPMKTFWTRRMVEPWDENKFANPNRRTVVSSYKLGVPNIYLTTQWEHEKIRFLSVDKQESGYWFVARACGERGISRLIDRGSLDSYAEIEARRIDLGVAPQCVLLDFGFEINECASAAIKYGWTGMMGVERDELFTHFQDFQVPGTTTIVKRKVLLPYSEAKFKDPMMGTSRQVLNRRIQLVRRTDRRLARYYHWINLHIKNLLAAFKSGDALTWELPEDIGAEYMRQINAETRHRVINAKGKRTDWWSNTNAKGNGIRRPNHQWDCECQIVVAMCIQQMIDLSEWNPDNEEPAIVQSDTAGQTEPKAV